MRGRRRPKWGLWVSSLIVGCGLLLRGGQTAEPPVGELIAWSAMRAESHCVVKLDPQRRWVAQWEGGSWGECPVRVWRLRSDWTLGEEVLNTRGKGLVVLGIEWVGGRLLIKAVEGVKSYWELDKEPPYQTAEEKKAWWARNLKLVVWDPQAPERWEPQGVYEGAMGSSLGEVENFRWLAHPSGEKVIGIGSFQRGRASYEREVRVFGLPLASGVWAVGQRTRLAASVVREQCMPLYWCGEGERFWAMGSDQRGFGKVVVVGLDGTVKTLTPESHHLLHDRAVATHGGGIEGGLEVERPAGSVVLMRGGKELAAVMSYVKPRHNHICVGYYSGDKLERERVIIGEKHPYPESLRPLRQCMLVTIVPDGERLILQQGWLAPHGAKESVWVWNMNSGAVRHVASVGWITRVYEWIGEEGMVVEMKGEPGSRGRRSTFEYGVLRLPRG
ncbi:MAG: hypothetical protein NZT92_03055 [Abditibacteriales bacterium]|nr:hypothetical protein [Abditibacteriales bacterium]